MLEIFIPIWIKKQKIQINKISNKFLKVLKNSFSGLELKKFDSTFFEWIKINSKNLDKNLIILCNWEFWENYFLDYDIFSPLLSKERLGEIWTRIIWENKIWEKIQEIIINITDITWILNSNKLLTNSKKKEIIKKITSSFFTLSWIIFLLYFLKEKTKQNLQDLSNYSWKVEYEAEASLLKEISITKSIELQASIDKLEGKIEMFIEVIRKFI